MTMEPVVPSPGDPAYRLGAQPTYYDPRSTDAG
jgi:hypothetical protein